MSNTMNKIFEKYLKKIDKTLLKLVASINIKFKNFLDDKQSDKQIDLESIDSMYTIFNQDDYKKIIEKAKCNNIIEVVLETIFYIAKVFETNIIKCIYKVFELTKLKNDTAKKDDKKEDIVAEIYQHIASYLAELRYEVEFVLDDVLKIYKLHQH